jgi:hypothetical protein
VPLELLHSAEVFAAKRATRNQPKRSADEPDGNHPRQRNPQLGGVKPGWTHTNKMRSERIGLNEGKANQKAKLSSEVLMSKLREVRLSFQKCFNGLSDASHVGFGAETFDSGTHRFIGELPGRKNSHHQNYRTCALGQYQTRRSQPVEHGHVEIHDRQMRIGGFVLLNPVTTINGFAANLPVRSTF